MKRRSFLARVLGVPAAAVAAPAVAKLAEAVEQVERKPVVIGEPEVIEPTYVPTGMYDATFCTYSSVPFGYQQRCAHCGSLVPHWAEHDSPNCINCGAPY